MDGEADKKLYKTVAKELSVLVGESIDRLALVKDSTAYTFKASLNRAIDTYFAAIPNNKKEQKRFDREQAKFDKLIARGKTPDYKVVPAKIVDLDMAKANIVAIIDKLCASYKKSIEKPTLTMRTKTRLL